MSYYTSPSDSRPGDGHHHEQEQAGIRPIPENPFGAVLTVPAMGPDPWTRTCIEYLQDVKPFVSKGRSSERSTYEETRFKMSYVGRVLRRLQGDGRLSTVNPASMTERDVIEIWKWMSEPPKKGEGKRYGGTRAKESEYRAETQKARLCPSTQLKYLVLLKSVLSYARNPVVAEMVARKRWPRVRANEAKKRILSRSEVNQILDAAASMGGWDGALIRHVLVMAYATGARPIELALQEVRDVVVDGGRPHWRCSYAKGDQAGWGMHTEIPLPEWYMSSHRGYMAARAEYLAGKGVDPEACPWLFPMAKRTAATPISTAMLRKLKADVQQASGVQFALKDLRKTFGQEVLLATDCNISAAQSALRHLKPETTYKHYVDVIEGSKEAVARAQNNRPEAGSEPEAKGQKTPTKLEPSRNENGPGRSIFPKAGFGLSRPLPSILGGQMAPTFFCEVTA